jgi:hypothetical protein
VIVTVNFNPIANAGVDQFICTGEIATLNATASGSLSYSYIWEPGNLVGQVVQVSPTVTTPYILTVIDENSCTGTDQMTVSLLPNPVVDPGLPQEICAGDSVVLNAYASNGGGGYIYEWNPGTISGSSVVVSPLATTTFTISVSDVNNCSSSADVLVTVNNIPVVNAGIPQTTCSGGQINLSGIAVGGAGGYSYEWNPGSFSGQSIQITPSATTTFSLLATDMNGCTGNSEVTIYVNDSPVANAGIDQNINVGSSTTLNASATGGDGNYIYIWTPGNMIGQSVMLSPTATTTFNLMVTDGNNCSGSDDITIFVSSAGLSADAGPDQEICDGNSVILNALATGGSGSYSFDWMPGNLSGQSISVSPAISTVYTLTITDQTNSEIAIDQIIVTVNPVPIANAGFPQIVCSGESVTLSGIVSGGSGGNSFLWLPGNYSSQTININPSVTTSYYFSVTDSNNCSGTDNVLITVNELPVVNAGFPQTSCLGDIVSLNGLAIGGAGSYDYIWNPGGFTSQSIEITPAATQTFVLSATDTNGCIGTGEVLITINDVPIANAGADQSIVIGGTATLSGIASGGDGNYTYVWTPGNYIGQTVNVYPSVTTMYTLNVTDGNSCTGTDDMTVTVGSSVMIVNAGIDKVICKDQTAILSASVSGGSGNNSFLWTPGNYTSETIIVSPLITTTYTLMVTDLSNSNQVSDDVMLTVHENPPMPTITQRGDSLLTISGYSYNWYFNGNLLTETENEILALVSGVYFVEIINENGCSSVSQVYDISVIGIDNTELTTLFKIYPNPNNGEFFIEIHNINSLNIDVKIHNVLGEIVYSEQISSHTNNYKNSINLSNNPKGVYFVTIKTDDNVFVGQLVLQ